MVHVLLHLVVSKGGFSSTGLPQFHNLETKEEPVKRGDTLVAPVRGCSRLAQRVFRIDITTRPLVLTSGASGVTEELSCLTRGVSIPDMQVWAAHLP